MDTLARFHYTRTGLPQEAGRLTEWQSGRLVQHDDTHYQYDKAGRLIRKQVVQPGYCPQVGSTAGTVATSCGWWIPRTAPSAGNAQHWPNHIPAFIIRYTFSFLRQQK
ncbi:hypothetical protein V6P93_15965 [Dickeya ananatis]